MAPETSVKLKFLAGGIAIGIVVWWILGFTVFGWVTGGTAQERIDKASIWPRSRRKTVGRGVIILKKKASGRLWPAMTLLSME
jgi:hypothetical protein